MVEPLETDKAWMAGFLDGEGTIGITITPGHLKHHAVQYSPRIKVFNTCKEPLETFEKYYLGKIYYKEKTGVRKDLYEWQCIAGAQVRLLHDLLPYLKVKKKQAILLLDYMEHIVDLRGLTNTSILKELERRETIRLQLGKLNERGKTIV